jgi:hypothetical protein
MKKLPHLLVVASLSSLAALAGASAQTAEPDLDLAAIRARASAGANDAEALSANARARAETLAREARTSSEDAEVHARRYTREAAASAKPDPLSTFDFDRMVADAGTMTSEGMGEAPRFIAFASLSMPPAALRAMIDDVAKAGGIVALRGCLATAPRLSRPHWQKSQSRASSWTASASTRACSVPSGSRPCPPTSSPAVTLICATGSIVGRRSRRTTG